MKRKQKRISAYEWARNHEAGACSEALAYLAGKPANKETFDGLTDPWKTWLITDMLWPDLACSLPGGRCVCHTLKSWDQIRRKLRELGVQ